MKRMKSMKSQLVEALNLIMQPVAIILTDERPDQGLHLKAGSRGGCVGAMLVAASQKGRLAYFDRESFGCPGGGTGLGFGDQYGDFPIDCLLSSGDQGSAVRSSRQGSSLAEGERFFRDPELARKWVDSLPLTEVPTQYVVFKPWELVTDQDRPELVVFFVNADQLSALVVMADYNRGSNQSVTAPFGAACQSILFGYAEARQAFPRGVVGFFDISQRSAVGREILTFTVPFLLFQEMEASVPGSFLELSAWRKLQKRQ